MEIRREDGTLIGNVSSFQPVESKEYLMDIEDTPDGKMEITTNKAKYKGCIFTGRSEISEVNIDNPVIVEPVIVEYVNLEKISK